MSIFDYNEIQDRVHFIVSCRTHIDSENITNDLYLQDIGLDSLDSMELILELENEFKIVIKDDEAETVKTVKNLIDLVNVKLN